MIHPHFREDDTEMTQNTALQVLQLGGERTEWTDGRVIAPRTKDGNSNSE